MIKIEQNRNSIETALTTNLERFYKTILCSYDGGIFVTDAQGIILWVTDNSEYFLGMSPQELIGKPIQFLVEMGVTKEPATLDVIRTHKTSMRYFVSKNGTKQFVVARPVMTDALHLSLVVSYTLSAATLQEITQKLERELANYQQLVSYVTTAPKLGKELIAASTQMKTLLNTLDQVAPTDSCILLQGESGTGKEVLARYIHQKSPRCSQPFVPVNCAAIPEELLEAELFGYAPNAFTGASRMGKMGLFAVAQEGTLLLDEIGEMPISMQAKLLRVLESGEYRRVGENVIHNSSARIIVATNRNLLEQVKEKQFRPDLYYRISILPIYIPPLRERREDILPLAEYFLQFYNEKHRTERIFLNLTRQQMLQYSWPGNVRELRNLVERMVLTTFGQHIMPESLGIPSLPQRDAESGAYTPQVHRHMGLHNAKKEFEQRYIQSVFMENQQNVKFAAKELQIPVSTLYQKLREYGINTR